MSSTPNFVDWSTIPSRQLAPGVILRIVSTQKVMLSFVEIQPGAIVPLHHHPHEQLGIWLEGDAQFRIGAEERHVVAGDSYVIPSNVPHQVVAGTRGGKALDIFSPPREDYLR